jgi:chemotaxis protein CheC
MPMRDHRLPERHAMTDLVHALVVRVGDVRCALPMSHVEQTFRLSNHRIHNVGGTLCLLFRGRSLPLYRLADQLGLWEAEEPTEAVIVWVGGRRLSFAVNELIGQIELERIPLPALAASPFCTGALIDESGEIIPVLDPAVVTGFNPEDVSSGFGLSEMQQSALREVGNIGSGQAATALSTMIASEVNISYAEALLVTASEAAGLLGSPLETSAIVETPILNEGGRVMMVFAGDSSSRLCGLLGVNPNDEMGHSALREVGNILSTSYMNAICTLTGMELEPAPPRLDVDLLGTLLERLGDGPGDDVVVLLRSSLSIPGDAGFTFTFVPQLTAVEELLERLDRAMGAAT